MAQQFDIYLKDEGDFLTVCFMTPKAIATLDEQTDEVKQHLYGDENFKKLDVALDQAGKILTYAITHDLRFDSELSINIGAKTETK